MIGRIIGSDRGIAGMVAYITHDQTSAGNRRPTTAERVAWTACLGIPTEGTELMVRAMQGVDRRRPGAEGDGRHQRPRAQAEESVHAPRAQLARGSRGSTAAGDAVGRRRRARQHRSRRPPLRGLRRTHRHGLPARARRHPPRRPGNGPAVNLDQGATRRLSRWAEQYERDQGGIVVPTRVERHEAQEARRDLKRRCRKSGTAPDQARSTTARLHPRPPAKPARKRPPSPDGSTPQDRAHWQRLVARQAEQVQAQRTAEAERVARRRREWRAY